MTAPTKIFLLPEIRSQSSETIEFVVSFLVLFFFVRSRKTEVAWISCERVGSRVRRTLKVSPEGCCRRCAPSGREIRDSVDCLELSYFGLCRTHESFLEFN